MQYLRILREVRISEIKSAGCSFSAGMYRSVSIPTERVKTVRDLLNQTTPFEKGTEPGSVWYMHRSTHFLIRTKALQSHSYLIYPKGDSIVPVNPRIFEDPQLKDGDLLISKDSNVGECAMVHGNEFRNHMFSGGIVRLNPTIDRFYLFAFLKHPLFKTQLLSKLPRGATITHAKSLWLDCLIPFPDQTNHDEVLSYVATLTQAIMEKEISIRQRHASIFSLIDKELEKSRNTNAFKYEYPTIEQVRLTSRLDTGLYCVGFQSFKHRVENYKFGFNNLSKMGVQSRRGPNLAVSVIGKSLYSEEEKKGWYELIRPVNISEYGTLVQREWLGTPQKLPTLNQSDIVLGCEGFEKGRSLVLIEPLERCTTNFHGTVLYWPDAQLWQIIFIRSFLAYLREHGVVDWVGVGGSGGHMSPEYFDYLPFPKFPDDVQRQIAKLYHSPSPSPEDKLTQSNFLEWHRRWNEKLGIWELDREMKALQVELQKVQAQIIDGKPVRIDLN
jgi:hypothetical protein